MAHAITLIPSDGAGSALTGVARRVLEATGVAFDWDEPPAGGEAWASVRRTKVALRAPAPADAGLDGFFARVRPCKAFEGARTRFPETDLVVVGGAGDDERVLRAAFDYARETGRGKVTGVGAAGAAVAGDYEGIEFEADEVDGVRARLLGEPADDDVLALAGAPGELVADLAAGMIGGPGLAPGVHVGEDARVFEPARGPGDNPTGLLLSGGLMLRHLGEAEAADRMEAAIAGVIRRGETVTYDLKPTPNDPAAVGTEQFADAVIEEMTT